MPKRRKKKSTAVTTRRAPKHKTALTVARRRRKKRGLADAFTPASAKVAAMTMVKGAAGGLATAVLEKGAAKFIPASYGKAASIALVLAGSFVAHAVMKQPDISAGMAGALGYSLSKNIPGLNDDADFADDLALYDDAPYMDENGNPMDENGNYLSEGMYDGDMGEGMYDDNYLSGDYDQSFPSYN